MWAHLPPTLYPPHTAPHHGGRGVRPGTRPQQPGATGSCAPPARQALGRRESTTFQPLQVRRSGRCGGSREGSGVALRGREQREETSRPHPLRALGAAASRASRGGASAAVPARPPRARSRGSRAPPAGARTRRGRALRPRGPIPAPLTRLAAATQRGGGLGSRVARDGESLASPRLASPTSSLFSSEVTARGGASDERADTATRDRET